MIDEFSVDFITKNLKYILVDSLLILEEWSWNHHNRVHLQRSIIINFSSRQRQGICLPCPLNSLKFYIGAKIFIVSINQFAFIAEYQKVTSKKEMSWNELYLEKNTLAQAV